MTYTYCMTTTYFYEYDSVTVIDNKIIEQVNSFNYLGNMISS